MPSDVRKIRVDVRQSLGQRVLEEEQGKVLRKMLELAGTRLSDEERRLILMLEEQLLKKSSSVAKKKSLFVDHQSRFHSHQKSKDPRNTQVNASAVPPQTEKAEEKKPVRPVFRKVPVEPAKPTEEKKKELPPDLVVKLYLKALNERNFEFEYDCYAPEMTPTSQAEYVALRWETYREDLARGITRDTDERKLETILETETSEIEARVVCIITENLGGKKTQNIYEYTFTRNNGQWKIRNIKQRQKGPFKNIIYDRR